ncbi:TetR/AcrR family transcriptional regulator [Pseudosulfitobacter pseudonitzschiae]|uniref:TetR/AcrR family transcriptional regulator n=1 Tax=Pseudosulfitobacter pseudonitzschiae TaxID=1402135 RepID=UPI001CD772A8|nr:TetR/AcrR family transcriptional regulator [Pseudosulfitobacter pseudonitzschiae]
MSRPTKHAPERGDARNRLLEAARDIVRKQGFAATTVDDLCKAAGVTKGAFFHHFKSKDALGVAAANFWTDTTGAFFEGAPYHAPSDPFDRVLAYIAFRRAMITNDIPEFTCLVGTLVQEVHATAPEIRDAARCQHLRPCRNARSRYRGGDRSAGHLTGWLDATIPLSPFSDRHSGRFHPCQSWQ